MDIYYEQNVVNNNIDERTKKTRTLSIAKTICWVLGVFILVSSGMQINMFWVFLILAVPLFVAALVIGYLNKRNNTEYDYVIDDEYIKISEIYFRQRRKQKYTIRLRLIESVGVFNSEGYKKIERAADKKFLALVNYDDEKSVIYILYGTDKGKRIVFIEPDRGFMIALRRVVSALTVFDKSIADFEKRLTLLEEQAASEVSDNNERNSDTENTAADNDLNNSIVDNNEDSISNDLS